MQLSWDDWFVFFYFTKKRKWIRDVRRVSKRPDEFLLNHTSRLFVELPKLTENQLSADIQLDGIYRSGYSTWRNIPKRIFNLTEYTEADIQLDGIYRSGYSTWRNIPKRIFNLTEYTEGQMKLTFLISTKKNRRQSKWYRMQNKRKNRDFYEFSEWDWYYCHPYVPQPLFPLRDLRALDGLDSSSDYQFTSLFSRPYGGGQFKEPLQRLLFLFSLISSSCWSFTGVLATASLFKYPGLFSVFRPI